MTMTYAGTTSVTTAANPPLELKGVVGGQVPFPGTLFTSSAPTIGGRLWMYSSSNAETDVDNAGAFSDGGKLGMKPGDVVLGCVLGIGGLTASTDMYPYIGILNSTETSLSSAGFNICSNYST